MPRHRSHAGTLVWGILTLFILDCAPLACTSPYRRTLREMPATREDLVEARIDSVIEAQTETLMWLERSTDMAGAGSGSDSADSGAAYEAQRVEYEARWWVWESARRLAALNDVLDAPADGAASGAEVGSLPPSDRMIAAFEAAQDALEEAAASLGEDANQPLSPDFAPNLERLRTAVDAACGAAEEFLSPLEPGP